MNTVLSKIISENANEIGHKCVLDKEIGTKSVSERNIPFVPECLRKHSKAFYFQPWCEAGFASLHLDFGGMTQ